MRTIVKTALLSVLMVVLATACEKIEFPMGTEIDAPVAKTYQMSYTVDGEWFNVELQDEESYGLLFASLVQLTDEGHVVTIHNNELYKHLGTKDVERTETKDKAKIVTWTKDKTEKGYEVVVEKEESTGTYKGTATK